MRARYKDRSEKSTNGVGIITPLHSAWSESHVCDAVSVSDDWKGVPTVKNKSATKPEVEVWRS